MTKLPFLTQLFPSRTRADRNIRLNRWLRRAGQVSAVTACLFSAVPGSVAFADELISLEEALEPVKPAPAPIPMPLEIIPAQPAEIVPAQLPTEIIPASNPLPVKITPAPTAVIPAPQEVVISPQPLSWWQAGLQDADPSVRKSTAEKLTWTTPPIKGAMPLLLASLNDSDSLVRATAARAVWEIDGNAEVAVPVLVDLLETGTLSDQQLAAYYLGPIGESATLAVPTLNKGLQSESMALKVASAEALAQISPANTASAHVLAQALSHPNGEIRSWAAVALGHVDPQHATIVAPALAKAAQDSDAAVRTAAELALPRFKTQAPIVEVIPTVASTETKIEKTETHPLSEFSEEASVEPTAENTTPFGAPGEVVMPSQPVPVKPTVEVADVIPEISKDLQKAIDELSDPSPMVRKGALERIGWMGAHGQAAFVEITMCLSDSHPEVRAYAAKALYDVDKASTLAAVNTLQEMVDSTQPGVRPLAAFYLGYIGKNATQSLPTLKRALANSESIEQLQIAEAVARINPEDVDAVTVLIGGLRDEESHIRFQAAYALGEVSPIHASRVIPELATAMADQSPDVQQAAKLAIQNFPADALQKPEATPEPIVMASSAPEPIISPRQQPVPSDASSVEIQPNPFTSQVAEPPEEPAAIVVTEPVPEPQPPVAVFTSDVAPEPEAQPVAAIQSSPEAAQPIPTEVPTPEPAGTDRVVLLDPEPVPVEMVAGEYGSYGTPAQETDDRLGLGDDFKSVSDIAISISPKRRDEDGKLLPLPTNYGAAWLQDLGQKVSPTGESRPWTISPVQYAASGFCHRPLYFEEINLERYGHTFGPYIQPFVSAANFYGRVPLMPYLLAAEPPWECQYTLGHYRAGNCVPYQPSRIGFSKGGTLLEAGLVTALFFAIY